MNPDETACEHSQAGRSSSLHPGLRGLTEDSAPLFENEDWLVDVFGLRSKMQTGTFDIPAKRLGELTTVSAGSFLFWPMHMAHEPWIKLELFAEAYRRALTIHQGHHGPPIPDALVKNSLLMAAQIYDQAQRSIYTDVCATMDDTAGDGGPARP